VIRKTVPVKGSKGLCYEKNGVLEGESDSDRTANANARQAHHDTNKIPYSRFITTCHSHVSDELKIRLVRELLGVGSGWTHLGCKWSDCLGG
jgi:hypothetical protein